MTILLETAHEAGLNPYQVAIGVSVFLTLLVLMMIVHGIGASRPHS